MAAAALARGPVPLQAPAPAPVGHGGRGPGLVAGLGGRGPWLSSRNIIRALLVLSLALVAVALGRPLTWAIQDRWRGLRLLSISRPANAAAAGVHPPAGTAGYVPAAAVNPKLPPVGSLPPYPWAGKPGITAEEVEEAAHAWAAALPSKLEACAGTLGGWCERFLAQAGGPGAPALGPGEVLAASALQPPADKTCPKDCSGNGVCDHGVGVCMCPAWWRGPACTERFRRLCNWAGGGHPAARCPGPCDDRMAHCYCPSSTKHGGLFGRPMASSCVPNRYEYFEDEANYTVVTDEQWAAGGTLGVKKAATPGIVAPELLFGDPAKHPEIKQPGWCVADVGEQPTGTCPCGMDGTAGALCLEVTRQLCPADCSDHGRCEHGYCWCEAGWHGTDCSRRKQPIAAEPAGVVVETPRPRIYVYDLPGRFNTHILQYRVDAGTCTHRYFTSGNGTSWRKMAGYLDIELHEALLRSPHRTFDPETADFFFVPMYLTCYIWPVANFASYPRHAEDVGIVNRQHAPIRLMQEAREWIAQTYPFWDRKGGKDHIWYLGHDEGACWAPAEIRPSILLSHWGRMDPVDKFPVSSSAFPADNYDNNPRTLELIGAHACHDPSKDLVIPPFTIFDHADAMRADAAYKGATKRGVLFSFQGQSGADRSCPGVKDPRCYSRGIRQEVVRLYKGKPGFTINAAMGYSQLLASSRFCFVAPGDGFSTRAEDAVLHGCVPVLIQDNTLAAWGTVLDWQAFSVRIKQADIPRLETLLRAIPLAEVEAKLAAVAAVASRFDWTGFYRHPRPPKEGRMDALATLMGALYQKAAQLKM